MKTDTIFYRLCQTAPGLLLELAGLDASQTSAYQFRSVEVKQTAFLESWCIPDAAWPQNLVNFTDRFWKVTR